MKGVNSHILKQAFTKSHARPREVYEVELKFTSTIKEVGNVNERVSREIEQRKIMAHVTNV